MDRKQHILPPWAAGQIYLLRAYDWVFYLTEDKKAIHGWSATAVYNFNPMLDWDLKEPKFQVEMEKHLFEAVKAFAKSKGLI